MSPASVASSRSGYVSHLRRAFLLRAHPDRFRKHSETIVKGQASIIQSLAERLTAPDFNAYVANKNTILQQQQHQQQNQNQQQQSQWKTQSYYLERKNGDLVQHTLPLNNNVEGILESLSKALESTGLAPMKPPSVLPDDNMNGHGNGHDGAKIYRNEELNHVNSKFWSETRRNDNINGGGNATSAGTINHSFGINTTRGRDLLHFITNLDKKEIEQRKADRIDASAAVLVARQAFKFQSIDGTGLGWSSSSLAKCIKILTKVYDEHCDDKFKVDSFYPFQLILSNDEFLSKLDLYGGKIMLNPGSTQEQWLETLMAVTDDIIQTLESNRDQHNENLLHVQNALNIRCRKGFSCSSEEYFFLMDGLASVLKHQSSEEETESSKTNALALDRIGIVVETHQACRRPVVTKKGEITISASMTPEIIMSSISKLRHKALQTAIQEKEKGKQARELIKMLKYEYGITKVYKHSLSTTTSDQYLQSLSNILQSSSKEQMKEYLVGHSLGITSSGRSCHLGDDGSLLIPWDWS